MSKSLSTALPSKTAKSFDIHNLSHLHGSRDILIAMAEIALSIIIAICNFVVVVVLDHLIATALVGLA